MPIYINDTLLETFKFPGGECHFNISNFDFTVPVTVTAYLYSSDDIMTLLLFENAMMVEGSVVMGNKLIIPYLPYARQDRVCNPGEPFSLFVISKILGPIFTFFPKVYIVDPHSNVYKKFLPPHTESIFQWNIIKDSNLLDFIKENDLMIIGPDKGSREKIQQLIYLLYDRTFVMRYDDPKFLIANKIRDSTTGKITSIEIEGNIINKNFIIIDDICDGGATFIELAKVLKAKGCKDLYLYVTHGIFSRGLDVLRPYFKHVYCYHTMLSEDKIDREFLTILKKGV